MIRVTTTGEMVKFFEAVICSFSSAATALKANPRIDILNFCALFLKIL